MTHWLLHVLLNTVKEYFLDKGLHSSLSSIRDLFFAAQSGNISFSDAVKITKIVIILKKDFLDNLKLNYCNCVSLML